VNLDDCAIYHGHLHVWLIGQIIEHTPDNTRAAPGRGTTAGEEGVASGSTWRHASDTGVDGTVYVANPGNDAHRLVTETPELTGGTYDLFAFFWGNTSQPWRLAAGLSPETVLTFRALGAQAAEAEQFAPGQQLALRGPTTRLYRAYLGRVRVDDGESVAVYIDDDPRGVERAQTWYDGLGYARVEE